MLCQKSEKCLLIHVNKNKILWSIFATNLHIVSMKYIIVSICILFSNFQSLKILPLSVKILCLILPLYSGVITRSNFGDTVLNQLLYAHNGWKLSWVVHLMQKLWDSFLWPQAVRFQTQKMGNLTFNYISETENKDETILFILYIIQP